MFHSNSCCSAAAEILSLLQLMVHRFHVCSKWKLIELQNKGNSSLHPSGGNHGNTASSEKYKRKKNNSHLKYPGTPLDIPKTADQLVFSQAVTQIFKAKILIFFVLCVQK